ncbi:FG-GAP-like repeat-containing protein [Streptomyces sp. NBC_00121]|uniref:FG-GAP-like repeat-containing protein n=1 Tax=unclassified Streptomyces TaxID=2593676 RepID=UPI002DD82A8C|nr:FG-GAP-like repeat-containing protein [Streptomyces sp. NBC_01760]WSC70345.1 FG-GAP-like repeat-containing protein [Streptomyces sp. NBC_01760]
MTKTTRGTWAPVVALMMTGLALGLFPQAGTAWASAPSFAPHVDYPTGDRPSSVAVGDLDGDGDLDLAIANTNALTVSVLLGNGDGTFAPQVSYPTADRPYSVAVGDLDGDGDLDLVTANYGGTNTVSVLLGDGDGTFAPHADYPTEGASYSVAVGDLDGDGDLDLTTSNYGPVFTVSVLLGKGDGTFPTHVEYPTGGASESVAVGDLNGDGDLDLTTSSYGPAGTVSVLLGKGDGTFAPHVDYPAGAYSFSVVVGDLDGDGDLDLTTANPASAGTVSVLLGKGDGTFAPHVDYPAGAHSYSVAVGDLDGDGDVDLAAGNYAAGTVSVLLGDGDGTFAPQVSYPTGAGPLSVAVGDLDGDGDLDLAAGNYDTGTVSVLLNTADTTPPTAPVITTPADGRTLGDSTPAFAGTGEAGSKVTVSDAGGTVCTATVDASGKWTCTPITALAEGKRAITATATDEAGNISPGRTISITIDTTPPAAPVITSPGDGKTLGDRTPAFAGTGEVGSSVRLTDAGGTVCTATVDASGKWTCTPTIALAEGEHTLTPTATDAAGNSSQGQPITITIAPPAPVITAPADGSILRRCSERGHDAGEWAGGGGCLLTFTGTGGPGNTVTVTEGRRQICSATVNDAGNWSCSGRTRRTGGEHTFIAIATGSTGAIAKSEPVTVKLRHRPYQERPHRSLATTAPGVRKAA